GVCRLPRALVHGLRIRQLALPHRRGVVPLLPRHRAAGVAAAQHLPAGLDERRPLLAPDRHRAHGPPPRRVAAPHGRSPRIRPARPRGRRTRRRVRRARMGVPARHGRHDELRRRQPHAAIRCPADRASVCRTRKERASMTTYVYYPRGLATGGPEALHQLVDSLRRQGQDAYLVPIPGTATAERAARYDHYDAPEAGAVDDAAGNIVVVPETQALLLKPLRRAQGYLWWLSIDYAPRFVIERDTTSLLPIERTRNTRFPLLQVRRVKRYLRGIATREDALLARVGHLAQSHYAWNHVFAHLGRPGSIVSDYTPAGVSAVAPSSAPRIARIAYNPAKSRPIMAEFARRWPGIELLPLQNMTADEVAEALATSLVYLDLGAHPGKDRMPREAALAGSIVLVANRGAAANGVDVPLPQEHKIDVLPDIVANAKRAYDAVLADPAAADAAQADYRARIPRERDIFDAESRRVFIEATPGSDGAAPAA